MGGSYYEGNEPVTAGSSVDFTRGAPVWPRAVPVGAIIQGADGGGGLKPRLAREPASRVQDVQRLMTTRVASRHHRDARGRPSCWLLRQAALRLHVCSTGASVVFGRVEGMNGPVHV